VFLFRWFPWPSGPLILFSVLAILIGLLYWQVERGQFRTDRRAMPATIVAGLLWASGAVGSGWCCLAHVCMAGHMEHPPYALSQYATDLGWALSVAGAALWMRFVRSSVCLAFAVLSSFLISYRFLFGSLGGRFEWLPL